MRSILLLFVSGCCFGCSQSGEIAALKASLRTSEETIVAASSATVEKTDEAIVILKENTAALSAIKSLSDKQVELNSEIVSLLKQKEASLVKSNPNGKEVIQSAPESPAKANTQTPVQVATPGTSQITSDGTRLRWNIEGNWNPTILETSAHLAREHGIDTNGMTHQQMADIHADLHDGKPVAMKAKPVQYVTRGMSCPNGQCPTSTRFVQRRRR